VIEDVPTLMPPTPDEREADHIEAGGSVGGVGTSWVPRHVRRMGDAPGRALLRWSTGQPLAWGGTLISDQHEWIEVLPHLARAVFGAILGMGPPWAAFGESSRFARRSCVVLAFRIVSIAPRRDEHGANQATHLRRST
jgi:hypothetical protein